MYVSPMPVKRLESGLAALFTKAGMRPADARAMAWVYTVMTLRGVGHHDVGGVPRELERLSDGSHQARPRIRTLKTRGAVAVMDGDNAPGPLAAYRMTEEAIRKARRHGIGMAVVRNSNHFIGAAPYALLAARHGMLGVVLSNTVLCMGTGRSRKLAIGNNPWGFSVETGAGFPLLLDICNAYASYGKLHEYRDRGWKLPAGWGLDRRGRPTTDAAKVIDGVPLPMADHKGFGMAVLMEILSGVLSGGAILNEVGRASTQGSGACQAALVIDIAHFMSMNKFKARTRTLMRKLKAHRPLISGQPTLLPGERSHRAQAGMIRRGVPLRPETVKRLNEWEAKLSKPRR